MKKYDNYKDSGVEWLGEMPSHWNLSSIKFLAKIQNGSTPSSSNDEYWNGDVNWVTTDDLGKLVNKEITETRRTITKLGYESCGTSLAPIDSIVMSTRAPIGHIGILKIEASTNQGCKTIIPLKVNSLFCYYYFLNSKEVLQSLGQGSTFKELPTSTLKDFKIVFPSSIEEQFAIASFLDHKTSQIDHLIAKKEQFIKLLEEERIAVINQAVTKGIDPNVPMKDSGVEWLGEIPAHWVVKRMRYICDITTGGKDTENREDDGLYPFYVRSQTIERISSFSFDGEAILTAGDGVGVCKVWHYVNEKFDFHQRVYMLSNFQTILGKYLFYYLKENFGKEVMKLSAKSTVDSLRRPMFQNFPVSFSSISEQESIVCHIEKEEKRIELIINKSKQEIELLKEYKTALISEVVTGKVDVR